MAATGHPHKPRSRRHAAAAAAILLALTGALARPGAAASAFGQSDDYVEARLAPDRWRVNGSGRSGERARNAAFYRGAVLAKAAGFSHLQFIAYRLDAFDYSNPVIQTKAGEIGMPTPLPVRTAFVEVTGVNDPAALPPCAPSAEIAMLCRTISVDEALTTLGALVGRTPAQSARDVDAARRAMAGRRRH